jgi:hypothetical protein
MVSLLLYLSAAPLAEGRCAFFAMIVMAKGAGGKILHDFPD